ncbi:CD8A protein, partial [Ptilonorhynchus violaceus]|nr:CD8A protein [Ptilonorhynchus violaceus]
MDRSPALLLLLTLGLCCPGIHAQQHDMKVRSHNITQLRVGHRLELGCQTDGLESGISWIRQDKNGTLHFIVFISSTSQLTFEGNQKTSTHFEASKDSKIYQLVVKSFTAQDEGKYFCIVNMKKVLYFSTGQPAFF